VNPAPRRIDQWNHVEDSTSMATTIYSNDKFVFINRTINANGTTQVTFVPIMHGSELERLIAALQAAQNMHG
jgi:hypothetical protein